MAIKTSDTTVRYIISTAITFAAGFLVVVTPEVQNLSVDALQDGALLGIILAGARAGVKAVAEAFILRG
jgi:hypothetical protein